MAPEEDSISVLSTPGGRLFHGSLVSEHCEETPVRRSLDGVTQMLSFTNEFHIKPNAPPHPFPNSKPPSVCEMMCAPGS